MYLWFITPKFFILDTKPTSRRSASSASKESVCLLRSLGSVGWSIVDRLSDGRGIGGTVVGLLGPAGFGT